MNPAHSHGLANFTSYIGRSLLENEHCCYRALLRKRCELLTYGAYSLFYRPIAKTAPLDPFLSASSFRAGDSTHYNARPHSQICTRVLPFL